MIKVTVMYPYTEGARFDHVYYRDQHMPMVKARLGSACAYYTVEKGLAGRAPGAPPAFVAMCAFICDSAEGYQAAMQSTAPRSWATSPTTPTSRQWSRSARSSSNGRIVERSGSSLATPGRLLSVGNSHRLTLD
jgi:uncharacterized protein (TIGR02118 family)